MWSAELGSLGIAGCGVLWAQVLLDPVRVFGGEAGVGAGGKVLGLREQS